MSKNVRCDRCDADMGSQSLVPNSGNLTVTLMPAPADSSGWLDFCPDCAPLVRQALNNVKDGAAA